MIWQTKHLHLIAACAMACVAPSDLLAQSLFGGNGYGHNPYAPDLTMTRIIMMALSVGAGFGLGWILSPQAKELRA